MVEPTLRIQSVGERGETFVIWCDSWVNKDYNIIGLKRTRKPPLDAPHQNFAQLETYQVCEECLNHRCKYKMLVSCGNVYIDKEICPICKRFTISVGFDIIHNQLIKSGLLKKGHKMPCCYCFESGYTEPEDIPHEFLDHR